MGKTVKVTISVTEKELNTLEDYITCFQVCDKHKQIMDEDKLVMVSHKCKACIEVKRKHYRVALHLWNKLCTAYDKVVK